jgi:hypothetical protein
LVEKGLQDERCRNLIDDPAVLLAGVPCLVKDLMGLMGGEALVPKMDGQAAQLAELSGEGLGFDGLGTRVAGKAEGIANHNGDHLKTPGETGDGP